VHKSRAWAPWTNRQHAILREVYPVDGLSGCADALPQHSLWAIRHRLSVLKIPHPARWCGYEDRLLRELYPNYGPTVTQGALPHRTFSAIYSRAYKLGITRKQTTELSNG
jgi:hypothetical protein